MTSFGVPWEAWEPIYEEILAEFGFDRAADEAARDQLARVIDHQGQTPADLPDATGKTVAIAGGAATLQDEVSVVDGADLVFAASTASQWLADAGIDIDLHVTDLDKDEAIVRSVNERRIPIAVHAHGDNRAVLEDLVPSLDARAIFPTTQAEPVPGVFNPGGFTDGDRAAFLADALGADRLAFAGWAFDDPTVTPIKRRKLAWAERLLYWLEQRRVDRFTVLAGRRDAITLPGSRDH